MPDARDRRPGRSDRKRPCDLDVAAREGAAVACADIDAEAANTTVGEIEAEGGRATAIVADAADPDQCAQMVDSAIEALGGVDAIVLNVGVGLGAGLEGTSVDDWDLAMAVNLRSHFLVCKAALPVIADGGSIVFLGSVAGFRAGRGRPPTTPRRPGSSGSAGMSGGRAPSGASARTSSFRA